MNDLKTTPKHFSTDEKRNSIGPVVSLLNGKFLHKVRFSRLIPLLAVFAALVVGALLLYLAGYDPIHAYKVMWQGIFGGERIFSEVLIKATPLIFVGAGLAIAFQCGIWNIGGEGQFYAGAILASWVGIHGVNLPALLLVPAVLAAGFVGGGLLAVIPGWLKVRLNVNEVVVTIMLNYIMIGITSFLVTGPMQELSKKFPQTDEIVAAARLPRIWPPTRLDAGFLLAILVAICLAVIIFRTRLGYAIQTVGHSPSTARYAGISVDRNIVIAMLLSGGAAGLGAAVVISGLTWRLFATISPGYGYDGIAVALLVANNPAGVILSGFLFGALRAGSEFMQMNANVPSVLVSILQGLIITFVVSFSAIQHRTFRFPRKAIRLSETKV